MDIKRFKANVQVHGGAEEGRITAMFSVFHKRDSDGDVVLPSFFKDGQAIPMSAWGHKWGELPPGKGAIGVQEKGAVFEGHFFMDTDHGLQHFRTVRNMGDLQEWSFGFKITEQEEREYTDPDTGASDGIANYLIAGETFEAAPVLVGSNRETETLAIKGGTIVREGYRLPSGDLLVDHEVFHAKGAIAPHSTPKDSEASWNGPAEVRRMPNRASVLRAKHAWVDPDGEPDVKSSYKFPHHPADRPHAIRAAVNNAKQEATALFMCLEYLEANYDEDTVKDVKARLPQANIPAGDRAGVLRHLNGHFSSETSQEPPDGKQSEWQEEADRDLNEALENEQRRMEVTA